MLLLALFGPGMLLVAGLDERLGWLPAMSPAVRWAGGIVMCLGYGLFSWGMAENQFFSSMVRIQGERGHAVCSTGPYRFVRHPGYIGVIVYSLAAPLLLGSAWAYIPAVLTAGVVVVRTVLEDGTLRKELEGYSEYAQKVRYRLIPGVW
jgi:protein-S-isoprenylcysteine O-methyltransferase Ste14